MDIQALDAAGWAAAIAQTPPEVDLYFVLRVVSRILHIGSAIILGGGIFYIWSILSPAGADACWGGRRVAWARWVGVASGLLIISGVINLVVVIRQAEPDSLPRVYHMLFGIKTLLALAAMFIAAIVAGRTSLAERARANITTWLGIGWAAVLAIVAIGATLRLMH